MKISIRLLVFSDRLFVSGHGGGGVHRAADGREGVGNSGVGATACWGVGAKVEEVNNGVNKLYLETIVTYCQTLVEVPRVLRLEKHQKR